MLPNFCHEELVIGSLGQELSGLIMELDSKALQEFPEIRKPRWGNQHFKLVEG
jgi:hypothetical protein